MRQYYALDKVIIDIIDNVKEGRNLCLRNTSRDFAILFPIANLIVYRWDVIAMVNQNKVLSRILHQVKE